jgi:hypothetical protein
LGAANDHSCWWPLDFSESFAFKVKKKRSSRCIEQEVRREDLASCKKGCRNDGERFFESAANG